MKYNIIRLDNYLGENGDCHFFLCLFFIIFDDCLKERCNWMTNFQVSPSLSLSAGCCWKETGCCCTASELEAMIPCHTWNILSMSLVSYTTPLISRNVYGQCTVYCTCLSIKASFHLFCDTHCSTLFQWKYKLSFPPSPTLLKNIVSFKLI